MIDERDGTDAFQHPAGSVAMTEAMLRKSIRERSRGALIALTL